MYKCEILLEKEISAAILRIMAARKRQHLRLYVYKKVFTLFAVNSIIFTLCMLPNILAANIRSNMPTLGIICNCIFISITFTLIMLKVMYIKRLEMPAQVSEDKQTNFYIKNEDKELLVSLVAATLDISEGNIPPILNQHEYEFLRDTIFNKY